jgi:hypothetical protein
MVGTRFCRAWMGSGAWLMGFDLVERRTPAVLRPESDPQDFDERELWET